MDLNNIVGFKAVDKNGKERQVTVDEMTELVSARIVSAASEISTFAAAAAAGTDEFEDQLPQSDTFSWLRTLDGSKNPTLTSSSAAAKVLGELMPIANLGSKGLLRKGVLSPILVCNKDSVQEVCVVRLASSFNAYIGMILYVYWGGSTGLFFINSKTGHSYIIRKVNGSIISEIEFKRKNDHLFVRSKKNTASFRVSALFLDTTGVDLSLSMNIVDENLDDAEDIEIL